VARGYAEGPVSEELMTERGEEEAAPPARRVVWGCTPENPELHELGELGEVDPDELFASGRAWGIHVALQE
jgi:hypothetical protein